MAWLSFRHRSALGASVRVAAIFSAFSILWIALTDRILGWLVRDPELLVRLATLKGMVYVVLMGMLVFWLAYCEFVDREIGIPSKTAVLSLPGTQSLGLWAPLTIFGISALLVALVGYQAFRFQSIAITQENGAAANLARTAWIGVALAVLFLALAGILLTLWWKREQMRVRAIHSHLEEERLSLKQQLELLSGYTNDIVLILDEQRHIIGANDRAQEAYGYSREELLALTVDNLRALNCLEGLRDQYQTMMTDGSLKFETLHERKDGSRLPVEVSARRFEQGGFVFIQSVIRDITEREEAKRALQESESQFRSIFEQADVGIVECSQDARFVRANPTFCEFLGYSPAELKSLTFMDVTHPGHRDEDLREVGRVLSGQRSEYRATKQYLRKDGTFVWGRTSVRLLKGREGAPKQLLAAIQDIDAWRHTEEKLQESETLVQRILDTTPNLIYIYDLIENRNVFVTRKIFDILGRTPDEIQAMGPSLFGNLIHPADAERVAQHHERIISARYPDVFELEYRMRHTNGQWRWLRSRDVLFARLKDGTPSQILGNTEDITEHKLAEDALRESEHFLQEAQKAARIGTYSWDILKNVWKASPELEAIFGIGDSYPRDLKGWTEIVAPEWRQRMASYVQEIQENGQPFDLDYLILRPSDGAFRWVHGQGEIDRDAFGNPLRMWGVIQDITDRKRDEESLRRTTALLNRSQAITRVGGYESDLKTGVVYWSDEMFRIHEVPISQGAPRMEAALATYAPAFQGVIQEAVRRLIEHGEGYDLELEKITATGRRIWVRNIAEAIQENGHTVKIAGALQDITERRQAQQALKEQRHRLSDILEGTRAGTWEWNLQTGEVLLNERWAEIVGWTLAELEPVDIRTWTQMVHPDDLETSNTLLDQHFLGVSPYYECECRFRHRDGSWVWVLDRGKVVQWTEDGKPLRMSGTHTDITERKVVEEIVMEREERFRALVENTEDTIMRFDREGRHLYVNPSVSRLLPMKPDDFTGKTHREMGFSEELCERWETALQRVFESGRPLETEFELAMVNSKGIIDWRLFPEFGSDGQVKTVLSFARDITAHRLSEKNYHTLFDQMLDGLAIHEIILNEAGHPVDYRFLSVNPAFESMTGLSAATVVGRTVKEVLPGTEAHWIETYGRVALTGESVRFEQHSAELGKHYHVVAFQPQSGQFACIFMDITTRLEAEDKIRRMNQELEQRVQERTAQLDELLQAQTRAGEEILDLYDRAPCGYHSLDENGVFIRINQTELDWLGFTREELIGQLRFTDLCTPESIDVFKASFPTFKARGSISDLRFTLTRKDGSTFPVLLSATAIKAPDGAYLMSRSTMLDITDLEHRDLELRQKMLELETTNQELEAFSYSVSHDLRAPLRGIDGFSLALLEDYGDRLDGEAQHYLNRIRRGTQRMGQIIDDLLQLSRVTRVEVERKPTDLAVMARQVFSDLAQRFPERQVEVILQEGLTAQADPRLILVVVENLLGNAWKYTARCEGARIEFGQLQIDGHSVFFVRDNGAGFNMQFAGKLFVPFQRLHSSSEYEGSGVGLAIASRVILRHGGRIWAESEPGQGATFFFSLPE